MGEQKAKKRGRPATYANAAERARAWRSRQKALIEQATLAITPTKPLVVDFTLQNPQKQQEGKQCSVQDCDVQTTLSAQEDIFALLESTVTDVTGQSFLNRLPAQRYIEELRSFFENIILKMPGYVYLKDCSFKYLLCNQNMLDFFGFASLQDLVRKTDYDFGWDKTLVDAYRKVDEEIVRTGQPQLGIEEVVYTSNHEPLFLLVNKMPLFNKAGVVIGIVGISVDITAQKEAERRELKAQKEAELLKFEMERERQQKEMLQLEKKAQQFLAEQQAKFKQIVQKAGHDIRSPLQAITTMLNACDELPEEKRTLLRKTMNGAFRILHDLASHYDREVDSSQSKTESRQDLLIVDYVSEVLDEKKHQYINHSIDFELHIADAAKTAHIDAQPGQMRRALSNLINNAIDALPDNRPGLIKVMLDADEKWVNISICDNGCGMTTEAIDRINNHIPFTENKADGHGFGLQQVRDALEYNRGKMKIASTIGEGTVFKLSFPRFKPAHWLVQELVLYPNTILLILDDEKLLHRSWDIWLGAVIRRNQNCDLQIQYFDEGEALLNFVQNLADDERKRVLLLSDYELKFQRRNGLQVIIDSKINNAILITGHTSNAEVRKAALERGINLLPKQLLADIPVRLEKDSPKAL